MKRKTLNFPVGKYATQWHLVIWNAFKLFRSLWKRESFCSTTFACFQRNFAFSKDTSIEYLNRKASTILICSLFRWRCSKSITFKSPRENYEMLWIELLKTAFPYRFLSRIQWEWIFVNHFVSDFLQLVSWLKYTCEFTCHMEKYFTIWISFGKIHPTSTTYRLRTMLFSFLFTTFSSPVNAPHSVTHVALGARIVELVSITSQLERDCETETPPLGTNTFNWKCLVSGRLNQSVLSTVIAMYMFRLNWLQ